MFENVRSIEKEFPKSKIFTISGNLHNSYIPEFIPKSTANYLKEIYKDKLATADVAWSHGSAYLMMGTPEPEIVKLPSQNLDCPKLFGCDNFLYKKDGKDLKYDYLLFFKEITPSLKVNAH